MESSLCLCRFGLDLSKANLSFLQKAKGELDGAAFGVGLLDKVAAWEAQFQTAKGHCAFSTQLFRSTAS